MMLSERMEFKPTVHKVIEYTMYQLDGGRFFSRLSSPSGIKYLQASTKGLTSEQRVEVLNELIRLKAMTKGEAVKVLLTLWGFNTKAYSKVDSYDKTTVVTSAAE